jgi:large subunit ribosomal protein L29
MSVKELRQKSAADLQKELLGLRREQFNLRMARATGQAAKSDQFGKVRKNIARLKTVMGEQRRAAPAEAPAAAALPKSSSAKKPASKSKAKGKGK